MAKKVIAVVGATGQQGGGLVRAILADADSPFAVRALTRDPSSEKAKALTEQGVEVVAASLDDEESLVRAFDGVYGAFCVTNFWDHFSPEREGEQARNLARAVGRASVRHVVWSTLEDTRLRVPLEDDRMPTLMGRYKVPHFDAKGEADQAFREAGVPVTFMRTTFYWDNMLYFGMQPRRGDDGVLTLVLPMGEARLSGVAAEDIGAVAYGIFREGPPAAENTVGVAGEHLTGAEMAAKMSRALGEEVRYYAMPPADYRALGFPGAEDLGNMFQYYTEFEADFIADRPLERVRQLHAGLLDFDAWLAKYASRIPV